MSLYPSIRIEGGLLGPDVLDQLFSGELPGQRAADFGLDAKRNLTDEIAATFADARALWGVFQRRLERVAADDAATTVTRDAWMIPLLGLLGYEPHYNQKAYEVDSLTFAISHRAGEPADTPPIHVVGIRQELGRVPTSGRPRLAPHSLVQEYLNRTEHVWGIVTNGKTLRLLRDSTFVRRQAYVEFDLPAILDEQRFQDFAALYRLLHRTRLPRGIDDAGDCLLEKYYAQSVEQGGRVREHLRDGVEECLTMLANGFLRHTANDDLRRRISPNCTTPDRLAPEAFYRQLLILVYRFLFLLVSEDRGLLSADPIYRQYYGVARLRRLLDQRAAFTDHDDLWQSLRVLWLVLIKDQPQPALGNQTMAGALGLAVLNGDLFAPQSLDSFTISNRDLLDAFWRLAWYQESATSPPRRVNYAALDVEELGSVYESLLEFHPAIDLDQRGRPAFSFVAGSERKTTGSYYTPPELVAELIKSALEPVISQRLESCKTDREKQMALLSIRVCDPACGSGHFLLAAARRLGKELARVRTGEDEPAPERVREAIRDVVSHCVYGVDRNPLAVDLCRVALWLESHMAEKPLTFLDHRIRCGDSLVGMFDLDVLKQGIPDKAFDAIEGDDKAVARELKRLNRDERSGVRDLFDWSPASSLQAWQRHSRDVDAVVDDSPESIRRKRQLFEESHADPTWLRQKQACDLWNASFFQKKTSDSVLISTAVLAEHLASRPIDARAMGTATAISMRQRFFHWPLEFPEVFADGGFSVILSNPPWEMLQLNEQEFFATQDPEIARLPGVRRKEAIEQLANSNVALFDELATARHAADAQNKLLRHAGRYPLTATGKMNTYALFAELARRLLAPAASAGIILPTGIATDDNTKKFFGDIIEAEALSQLIGFENEAFIFPAVHHATKFCALTLVGANSRVPIADFAFFCRDFKQVQQLERHFKLSREDFALLNPNTRTCPIFRTRTDAELTKKIYRVVPPLVNEINGQNPWGMALKQGLFNTTSDSGLFRSSAENGSLPLYEGKMIWQFDHRYATYEGATEANLRSGILPQPLSEQKANPGFTILPRYWIDVDEVEYQVPETWNERWFLGFRRITSSVVERTMIACIFPRVGASDVLPLCFARTPASHTLCLLGNFNALVLDYVARQKVGGTHMDFHYLKQIAVLPPSVYEQEDIAYIGSRVLELVYTANDLEPLAETLRRSESPLASLVPSTPYHWDEDRRAQLRADLDAWFARAYGLTRDELRYILDPADVYGPDFPGETFRVLKEKEVAKYGEYRTRRLVLEAWDALHEAQLTGSQTQMV